MKVILAIVTSADGKSTKDDLPPNTWASDEDQKFFFSLVKKHNLIVMGKNTYLASKRNIRLEEDKLRIVLTKNPEEFKKEAVRGQLEFTDESPKALVKRMTEEKFIELLLVSGATLNTAFFKDKLIDELWLTLEPKLFGLGKGLVGMEELEVNLKLLGIKRLNPQGTLLLKYQVIH